MPACFVIYYKHARYGKLGSRVLVHIEEEVGSASALIVGAKSAEAWHGVDMAKHRKNIMLAMPRHAGAQQRGTSVT